ncbi:MAG: hypothetical protein QT10_C0017G0014 [archaeon GW2011_AR19]|nr:MAG: hypothetical protein QT10_C0017G0014 [archaeon GW2011_AR19]
MVKIETLFKQKRISKINELELKRYLNFFENSYLENFEHCRKNLNEFSRWSIISGYYALHDITKLLIAKKFRIKIDFKVHLTTIQVLRELIKNKELAEILENGYKKFLTLANDLDEAKKERTKAQYYTGTAFMKEEYTKRAGESLKNVIAYINKIKELLK